MVRLQALIYLSSNYVCANDIEETFTYTVLSFLFFIINTSDFCQRVFVQVLNNKAELLRYALKSKFEKKKEMCSYILVGSKFLCDNTKSYF